MRQRHPLRGQVRLRPRHLEQETLAIETGRGVLTLDLEVVDGLVERVRVDMGEPILKAAEIPTTLAGDPVVLAPLVVEGRSS